MGVGSRAVLQVNDADADVVEAPAEQGFVCQRQGDALPVLAVAAAHLDVRHGLVAPDDIPEPIGGDDQELERRRVVVREEVEVEAVVGLLEAPRDRQLHGVVARVVVLLADEDDSGLLGERRLDRERRSEALRLRFPDQLFG